MPETATPERPRPPARRGPANARARRRPRRGSGGSGVVLRRVLAALGALLVLGVGIAVALLVTGSSSDDGAAAVASRATPAPSQTAAPTPARRHAPRLTHAQRQSRAAAIQQLRLQGFTPISTAAYRPRQTLRVLIGRARDKTRPGLRAFFFVREAYIGTDASEASRNVRVVLQRDSTITLGYKLASGLTSRVRFTWDGSRLQPLDAIPPPAARMPPS